MTELASSAQQSHRSRCQSLQSKDDFMNVNTESLQLLVTLRSEEVRSDRLFLQKQTQDGGKEQLMIQSIKHDREHVIAMYGIYGCQWKWATSQTVKVIS